MVWHTEGTTSALTQPWRGRWVPQRWRLLGGGGWGASGVCFGHSEGPRGQAGVLCAYHLPAAFLV